MIRRTFSSQRAAVASVAARTDATTQKVLAKSAVATPAETMVKRVTDLRSILRSNNMAGPRPSTPLEQTKGRSCRPTLPASDAAPRPGIDKQSTFRTGTQR